jgi:hypothetical protein
MSSQSSEEVQGHISCCKVEGGSPRKRKVSSGQGGARGRSTGRGGCGRGLGSLVCLSSEEEPDIIADVNKDVDTDATQEQVMPLQAHPHVQSAHWGNWEWDKIEIISVVTGVYTETPNRNMEYSGQLARPSEKYSHVSLIRSAVRTQFRPD